jgi:hypothetical protein
VIYHYFHDAGVVLSLWILTSIGMLVILGLVSWLVVTIFRHHVGQEGHPLDGFPRSPSAFKRHQAADVRDRSVIVPRAGLKAVHVPQGPGLSRVNLTVAGDRRGMYA